MEVLLPINKRKYHAFISHAHSDKEIVDKIVYWLTEIADIPIWYDGNNLPASEMIVSNLPNAVNNSRAMIIILSKASIESGWVEEEYNLAVYQRTKFKDFRIIPILIEKNCSMPGFLNTTKWIEIIDGNINTDTVINILKGMYYYDFNNILKNAKDIYISRSWRKEEALLADSVCNILNFEGFRLIGDSVNQSNFDIKRIRSIIASCGAFVAILPYRDNGSTSSYIIEEIKIAIDLNLPILVIADKKVNLSDEIINVVYAFDAGGLRENYNELHSVISIFAEKWIQPEVPHYVFLSTSFSPMNTKRKRIISELIELITAMPCIIGDNIREGNIQETIRRKISNAYLMITDISGENLNTCIEGGIALGAKIPLYLISNSPRKSPPFMFRDQQIWYYEDEVELIGIIHKILYAHRKHVINNELSK